jgi:hypothetical protein
MEDIMDTLDAKGMEWFIYELQCACARHERQVADALWLLAIEAEKYYHERLSV